MRQKRAPVKQEQVVILLSRGSNEYLALAQLLKTKLKDRATIIDNFDKISAESFPKGTAIAIGSPAARFLLGENRKQSPIFALISNHEGRKYLQSGMIGISMLPSPATVLNAFAKTSPRGHHIALIAGSGLEDYVELAKVTAKESGMLINYQVAKNDKEMLHIGKSLDSGTTAFWFLPDNRVLSKRTLRELMSANVKAGKHQIVFSPSLFVYGGLLSARFDLNSIANKTIEVLNIPKNKRTELNGRMLQPGGGDISINSQMIKTLGLTLPPELVPLTKGN